MEAVSGSLKNLKAILGLALIVVCSETRVRNCSCHHASFLLSKFPARKAGGPFPSARVSPNKLPTLLVNLFVVFYQGNTKETDTCDQVL